MLRKIGGLWFLRIGRLRLSFCLVRRARAPRSFAPATELAPIFTTVSQP